VIPVAEVTMISRREVFQVANHAAGIFSGSFGIIVVGDRVVTGFIAAKCG